jgi:mRNA interferase YafQ
MKTITRTRQFDRDVKKMIRRGKSFNVFKTIIEQLTSDQALGQKFKDHKLKGVFNGVRECHVEPDWLLLYINNGDELILVRTGTHADLF